MGDSIHLSDGARLCYQQQGQGTPIVLIPGWGYSAEIFAPLASFLSNNHRVICIDPRSHGKSTATSKGNNYLQHGKDFNQFVDQLGLTRFSVIAWSLGVYDVLSYISEYGHTTIDKLILVDESPVIVKQAECDWGEGFQEEIDALIELVQNDYLNFFRNYMAGGFKGTAPTELLDESTQYAASLTSKQAAGLLRDACEHDFRALLTDLNRIVPTLYVLRDDWSDKARNWIDNNHPAAEVFVLGGHLMIWEFAEVLAHRCLEFLGSH